MHHLHANGKLLITGEYLVLEGVTALALPLRYGQDMLISPGEKGRFIWKASDPDGVWLDCTLRLNDFGLIETRTGTHDAVSMLTRLLAACRNMNPGFLNASEGWSISTMLGFRRSWGLGSSSSLVSLLSQWSGVDPYELLRLSFGGSGYDIACATHDTPITYKLGKEGPVVQAQNLSGAWEQMLFVYSGRKQDSREAIRGFREHKVSESSMHLMESLSAAFIQADSISELLSLTRQHEECMSGILNLPPLKDRLFSDFEGEMKSLGAWGGDFMMAGSVRGQTYMQKYFQDKGFDIRFSFKELSLGLS